MALLVASLLAMSYDADLLERFAESLREAPPDVQIRFVSSIESKDGVPHRISNREAGKVLPFWSRVPVSLRL